MSEQSAFAPLPGPFKQLIGTWHVQRHVQIDDGTEGILHGEVTFAPLFGGRAMQDIWIVPTGRNESDAIANGGFRGTSIYYFDDTPETVHSVWIDPDQSITLRFSGKYQDSSFDLMSVDDRIFARWSLQLTNESTATWHAYRGTSPEGPWNLWEVMRLTRE